MEARPLLNKPLDVLVQHVVTIAIGGGFKSDELLQEVRTTQSFGSLTEGEFTGKQVIHPSKSDQTWVIAEDQILRE